mgnify:FL=1
MKKRIHNASALLLCAALLGTLTLSACSKNETGVAENEVTADTRIVSTVLTGITEITSAKTEETASEPTETTSQTSSETKNETETVSESGIEETLTEKAEETAENTAVTTSAPILIEETSTFSGNAEKKETNAAPKANIKPFVIKMPSANGKKAVKTDSALIDYSNADDGYIAAAYSGKSEKAKLRVLCGKTQYDHDLSGGGTTEFFPLMGSGSYTVRVYEQLSGKSYSLAAEASFDVKIKSETEMYLYPNKYSDFDKNSDCVKKASQLCSDKSGAVDKIAAIFGFVTDNISYDKELAKKVKNGLTGYTPDPDRTLKNGKGICFDYASLMTAMCRSQGIPSRIVVGYAKENIYHAWNEIYTEETGWITPELFLKNKGYNIADATFYSGQKDKKKIGEYISDSSNYSAMYRY